MTRKRKAHVGSEAFVQPCGVNEIVADEDVGTTAENAEKSGAVYADKAENVAKRFANRGQMENGEVVAAAREQDQRKYVDPNGIKFDIVNNAHARNSWKLPV